jgi:hypothetical protein
MFGPGGGFDFFASKVWRSGGSATRLGGGFLVSSGNSSFGLELGWERYLISQTITINLAFTKLPDPF